jgi:hypothetical protein
VERCAVEVICGNVCVCVCVCVSVCVLCVFCVCVCVVFVCMWCVVCVFVCGGGRIEGGTLNINFNVDECNGSFIHSFIATSFKRHFL